jgi:hypothetical protein
MTLSFPNRHMQSSSKYGTSRIGLLSLCFINMSTKNQIKMWFPSHNKLYAINVASFLACLFCRSKLQTLYLSPLTCTVLQVQKYGFRSVRTQHFFIIRVRKWFLIRIHCGENFLLLYKIAMQ